MGELKDYMPGLGVLYHVQTDELAADAITGAKIADDTIDSEHYAALSIDTEHLAADVVTGAKIADDQIDSEHYVALSIDSEHLAADVVTNAKIADNAVQAENLNNGTVGFVIPFGAAGAPTPAELKSVARAPAVSHDVDQVYLGVETLPNTTGSFAFNIRDLTAGVNLFSSNQTFARRPNVTGFKFTTDNGSSYTDGLTNVTDAGAGVATISSLDTVANGDWIVVGFDEIVSGFFIDMTANVNSNAETLAAHYWNGSAWTAVASLSDGTETGGTTTFGQDGEITFDTPADWAQNTIDSSTKYWLRLSVTGALSASVEITEADAVRAPGVQYQFTPDQNQTGKAANTKYALNITNADGNADVVVCYLACSND
jgi:hypothetical protein